MPLSTSHDYSVTKNSCLEADQSKLSLTQLCDHCVRPPNNPTASSVSGRGAASSPLPSVPAHLAELLDLIPTAILISFQTSCKEAT